MNIASIKRLVEDFTISDLRAAEIALLNEQAPAIAVLGIDEGEQLTHVIAAIFVREQMNEHGTDMMTAMRDYASRVRQTLT
ncbi:MAG: hypothetical protein H7X70_02210 [Candidatus Kapabacteria bacterium]|nr:hypothetical protein [Candidatus Kapabacteria bacterium]